MASNSFDSLQEKVMGILDEYAENISDGVAEATKAISKTGVKEMQSASKATFGGTGRYAKGWKSQVETGRLSSQGIIYNEDLPGLPHLLENGHVSRNGTGRTFGDVKGREHIAPVEEKVVEMYQKTIQKLI